MDGTGHYVSDSNRFVLERGENGHIVIDHIAADRAHDIVKGIRRHVERLRELYDGIASDPAPTFDPKAYLDDFLSEATDAVMEELNEIEGIGD